jgi:hypothetical protein
VALAPSCAAALGPGCHDPSSPPSAAARDKGGHRREESQFPGRHEAPGAHGAVRCCCRRSRCSQCWEEEEEAAGPRRCPRAVAQRAARGAGKAAGAAEGKVVCSSLELAQVLSPDTLPNRTVTL